MKKWVWVLVIGITLAATGWAIRSTFIMKGYVNKPLGGFIISVALFVAGSALLYGLLRRDPGDHDNTGAKSG